MSESAGQYTAAGDLTGAINIHAPLAAVLPHAEGGHLTGYDVSVPGSLLVELVMARFPDSLVEKIASALWDAYPHLSKEVIRVALEQGFRGVDILDGTMGDH